MEELSGHSCAYLAAGTRDLGCVAENARSLGGLQDIDSLWRLVEELTGDQERAPAIVLHYSGYGYATDGAPYWIADAMEQRRAGIQLITFFHELYATSLPWQRAFWANHHQKRVAIRLAQASDSIITNRTQSARWLESVSGRRDGSVASLPICSTIGEPERLSPWDNRRPVAVTFGGAGHKQRLLQKHASKTASFLSDLGITELLDIGPSVSINAAIFAKRGIEARSLGLLSADKVTGVFESSRIGLVDYPERFVTKSSVVAAFAAHGLTIAMPGEKQGGTTPTMSIDDSAGKLDKGGKRAEAIRLADEAWKCYPPRHTRSHAALFLDTISRFSIVK